METRTGYTSIDRPYRKILPDDNYDYEYCKKTAFDMIFQSPAYNPSSPAFDYYGKIIKNSTFKENVLKAQVAFSNIGVRPDDTVFMMCLNTPEMIYSLYGLNKMGAVSEWFNPTAISAEMLRKYILENNIKTMVIIDIMYPIVKEAIKGTKIEHVIVTSVKDSFDLPHKLIYTTQVEGINSILQNSYVRRKIAELKKNLDVGRVGATEIQETPKELNKLEKLLMKLEEYATKEKIRAKASYYQEKNLDSRFISWNDFIGKYYTNVANVLDAKYEDGKIAMIVHTGGTTGPVKRVGMTNYNINSAIYQSTITPLNMDFHDTFCQIIPPIVAWSLEGIHASRFYNMKTYLICTYDRNEFVPIVLKTKANHYFTVPSFVKTIINNPLLDGKDLSFIKTINHGGEAFSTEDDKAVDETLESHNCFIKTQFGFGQNEEFGCFTINLDIPGEEKDYSCCGVPFPGNDYIIVDPETMEELKYGMNEDGTYNIGELLVSGPTTMKGYIGEDEDKNEETIRYINGKKYIDTGDQAYIDDAGKLWYCTRNKRIIRTQDGKIFTNVIEHILNQIPEIEDSCVVASPHPIKVKEASCHIVLKPEYQSVSLQEKQAIVNKIIGIVEEATKKMYSYYVPGTYEFREESLPLTPFGKTDFMKIEEENNQEYKENGGKALKKVRYS